ncbi:MAG: MoaD/ThiS family protein [Candidatus Hodarchaeota archaeon]
MISLKLRYEPPFNEVTKKTTEIVKLEKEITLQALLEYFYEKYGEKFKELLWDKKNPVQFSSFLSIIVNGISYRDDKFLETILKDGDDIAFLYLYFGG